MPTTENPGIDGVDPKWTKYQQEEYQKLFGRMRSSIRRQNKEQGHNWHLSEELTMDIRRKAAAIVSGDQAAGEKWIFVGRTDFS